VKNTTPEQPMPSQELLSTLDLKDLLAKVDLIEEHARNTLGDPHHHLTKERQQMIIALVKQIRWLVAEDVLSRTDPEATVRMSS
jgi:hypothetical protein